MERPSLSTQRARSLRRTMTEVERWLWHRLLHRRPGGHKFVRRMPAGPFFADIACRGAKLIVEPDGPQHADRLTDARRDAFLVVKGFSLLRSWSREVAADIGPVGETIVAAVEGRLEPYGGDKIP